MAMRQLIACNHFHMSAIGPQPHGPATEVGQERVELLTDGRAWYESTRGELIEVGPGDLLWHVAGDRSISRSDPGDPYACLSVRFAVDGRARRPVPRRTTWSEIDRVRTFTREVMRYAHDPRFDRDTLANYCYHRLLFQARRSQHLARQLGLPKPLALVVERMSTRYFQQCDIVDMAALAGCSPSHLHALFKRHFATTPHQFLLERRLMAAREQLAASDEELGIVARRCGFNDASALCRAFKRANGISPQQWRRRERE